jgi:hypothetical protein
MSLLRRRQAPNPGRNPGPNPGPNPEPVPGGFPDAFPGDPAIAGPAGAAYLGTTPAASVPAATAEALPAFGRPGPVTLAVHRAGLVVAGGTGGFLARREGLRGARATAAHAGHRAAPGAVLVVDWVADGIGVTSGFELEPAAVPEWVAAVQAVVPE